MTTLRFAILALAALALAACLPVTTDNPIGSTAGFKPDPALIGLWKGHGDKKDDGDAYFSFLHRKDGSMTATTTTFEPDADELGVYELRVATLGASHIMNVQPWSDDGKPVNKDSKEIIPIRYDIGKDGKLTLFLLDDKKTTAAIKAGKLKGTVPEGSDEDGHITADPKSLDAFFATKEGAALFSAKLVTLTKVK